MKRLGKLLRQVIPGLFFLTLIENHLRRKTEKLEIPPVFIIGAPRSGSTLLYQYLTAQYQFAYIPNLVSVFYKTPLLIFKLFQGLISYKMPSYSSDFGFVEGKWSPSEAGKLYEYWFDKQGLSRDQIRETVFGISKITKAPLLIKNMNNTLRLERILEVFPEASIVHIRRETLYNAQSILLARKKLKGSIDDWWPRKPFNYEELVVYDPYTQVFRYLDTIEKYIEKQIDKKTGTSYHEISYERFCSNPEEVTSEWLDIRVRKKAYEGTKGIKEFENNNTIKLQDIDFQNLKDSYENHIRT